MINQIHGKKQVNFWKYEQNLFRFNSEMCSADENKYEMYHLLMTYLSKITFAHSLGHKVIDITKNTVWYDVIWCIKPWSS